MIIFSLIDMVFVIESDMFHGCIFLIWVLLLQFLNFAHRVREEFIYISLFERTRLSPHYFSWFSLAFAALSHEDNLFYIYQQGNLICIRLTLSLMPKAKMTWKKLVSITQMFFVTVALTVLERCCFCHDELTQNHKWG